MASYFRRMFEGLFKAMKAEKEDPVLIGSGLPAVPVESLPAPAPIQRTSKPLRSWSYFEAGGRGSAPVLAHTKSEARARFKRRYGFKRRLPIGAKVVEVSSPLTTDN